MSLDGSDHEPDFIVDDIALPNGLAVLPRRRELCWADAGKQVLACAGLDGGRNRRIVRAPLDYPFGLAQENEENFYWTDWKE